MVNAAAKFFTAAFTMSRDAAFAKLRESCSIRAGIAACAAGGVPV